MKLTKAGLPDRRTRGVRPGRWRPSKMPEHEQCVLVHFLQWMKLHYSNCEDSAHRRAKLAKGKLGTAEHVQYYKNAQSVCREMLSMTDAVFPFFEEMDGFIRFQNLGAEA